MRGADFIRLARGRAPAQIVIQITERCNAACPQCGMRAAGAYRRADLSLDQVKGILDAAADKGVRAVSFTGGEPFLRLKDLTVMIAHAGQAGIPYIRTGTNGFLFSRHEAPDFTDNVRRIAEGLAATPLRNLWISLDSFIPAVHEGVRGLPGLIEGLAKSLPILHAYGIYPAVNLGINRAIMGLPGWVCPKSCDVNPQVIAEETYWHFHSAFERYLGFVIELGFTMASVCYPMSIAEGGDGLSPVYAASSGEDIVRFSAVEKTAMYHALQDVIPLWRDKIRIFTPLSALYALRKEHLGTGGSYACRGGVDFFFIAAAGGHTYPCGYRGNENLGPFAMLDLDGRGQADACRACDWECFRDPSALFGPVSELLQRPQDLCRRLRRDPEFFRLWFSDLRYARRCAYYDGRLPFTPQAD